MTLEQEKLVVALLLKYGTMDDLAKAWCKEELTYEEDKAVEAYLTNHSLLPVDDDNGRYLVATFSVTIDVPNDIEEVEVNVKVDSGREE